MVRQCLNAWIAAALCALLTVGLGAGGALAQTDAAGDPPARVGRLSAVDGVVSLHTSDQDQWSPAMLNYPVSAGTSFWTEPSARAALELGPAVIHLGSQTEFDVVALDDHNFQGQIGQGEVHVRLYALAPGDSYQIVTARGTIQLTAPGRYHIDGGTDAAPTRVAVFDGAAEFVGNGANLAIHPGEAAQISGLDPVTYDVAAAAPDPVDSWADAGDARQRMVDAPRYVSPQMTGYQDLDGYGAWQQSPDAGPMWIPNDMPADWAPYRYGHWAYVAPWGWTWVDDASWGFAPFHYGRWARWHDRWAWYPGERIERPVYAPALVAFVGGPPAPGVSIGLAIGGIAAAAAWIPLGPHEVYDPPYRHSPTYIRNVNVANVTNVTNITNVTVNKTVTVNNYVNAGSATVVPAAAMTGSQPVAHAAVAVPAAQLAAHPVAAAPPAVHPTLATAGASPTAVRAAGGTVDPAHARRAAAGPVIAQGHPATAVALSHVQPPAPGPRPTPPRILASHEAPPNGAPNAGPNAAAPSATVAPPAEHHPAPAGAAPGPPIPPHGAPPILPSAHEAPATHAAPPPAGQHPSAPAVEAHREAPPPAEPPHPVAAPPPPHPAAAPPPPHPASAPAVEAHHEAPPHPAEPPHPAAAPPAPPHPAVEAHREAPPHPVEPPHPAAPPHPAVEAHAPPPPPHPAAPPPPAAHPAPPAPHPAPAHEAKKEEEHH
jgi:hypothetical protein